MRPIDLRDLLPRRVAAYDRAAVGELIRNRSVLITGAGGSIGSELTRQVAALNPSRLTLIDNCELNLYTAMEIAPAAKAFLTDVRDGEGVLRAFDYARPDVVFHAAALKHVPIVEDNPIEGVRTNVFGTMNVVQASDHYGVDKMVLISTDKAVDPCSVMGMTKRVAEMFCQVGGKTIVRFGNVLGSSGSVVPLFERQIRKGGPVTITHLDMVRFFMSVDEAVELVLQAAAAEPATYILNMGEPVMIKDLARDMIRLAGYMPDEMPIVPIGFRNGERLVERMTFDHETAVKTEIPHIMKVFSRRELSVDIFDGLMESLLDTQSTGHALEIIRSLVDVRS